MAPLFMHEPAERIFYNHKTETSHSNYHNWKISSSLSLSFLVSLVMVAGRALCAACCVEKDEAALWDLVSGRLSDVLLLQAASMAETL